MYTSNRLPVQSNDPRPEPFKRHQTARYYVHRVHESLKTRVSKFICAIFLGLLLTLGIIAFILWLSLRPHRPRFHIQNFSVPGLGQPNGFENAEIAFNVTIRNANQDIGIYYDSMDGAVYYQDQKIGSKPLLYPFYQKPKNTTIVYDVLSEATLTVNSQSWMQFLNDRNSGTVVFRLEITSTIRFKLFSRQTKHHTMYANCDVPVGPDGFILAISVDKKCPVYFT
ncbi:LEA_2 domain-containing protein [Cephalotus follicularis]|uniref:LEA_2 domain-containing protein n=1 Tax=Cephalotus follicularis TaxID=3775 RepID=A0A1Q3C7X5_CEPFO|nr:LEA_2 domain-containing protein [Cephalotus follicularis]